MFCNTFEKKNEQIPLILPLRPGSHALGCGPGGTLPCRHARSEIFKFKLSLTTNLPVWKATIECVGCQSDIQHIRFLLSLLLW